MNIYVEMFFDYNLGDDLFLDTLVERYPNHNFYLELPLGMELNPYFKKYKNLFTISNKANNKLNRIKYKILTYSFFNILKRIIRYDFCILIGGSLFEVRNKKDLRSKKIQYLKSRINKILNFNKILIGSNLGPFYNREGEEIVKKILITFDNITVRDTNSLNYLKKWNFSEDKYICGSDVIFNNKIANFLNYEENSKLLGISVVNSYSDTLKEKNVYVKRISEIIKLYLAKDNRNEIKLFGFDGGIAMSDKKLIEEIYLLLTKEEKKRTQKIIYSPEIHLNEYIKEFLECGLILGGRFHSIVLALKHQKKILAINYSEKIKNMLKDLNREDILIEYQNLDKVSSFNILSKFEQIKKINIPDDYISSSLLHFRYCDNFLKKVNNEKN